MTITRTAVVVAAREQMSGAIDGEVVIAGLRKGNYYGLNAAGARVWELVQSPVAVAELGRIIAAEYDVSAGQCEADLLELLESMRREGLIEVVA